MEETGKTEEETNKEEDAHQPSSPEEESPSIEEIPLKHELDADIEAIPGSDSSKEATPEVKQSPKLVMTKAHKNHLRNLTMMYHHHHHRHLLHLQHLVNVLVLVLHCLFQLSSINDSKTLLSIYLIPFKNIDFLHHFFNL